MIIDMRTHLDAWRLDSESNQRLAAGSCADGAVVAAFRSDRLGRSTPAESVASVVAKFPDRLVGFAGIDPSCESAVDDVDRVVELGLAGVTVSPADCHRRATSADCIRVFERCARAELPVLVANPGIHDPRSALEFAHPETLDEAAGAIDGLTLILGDIGHGWLDEALLMLQRHSRVFAELSTLIRRPWSLYTGLQSAQERGVLDKLLFASGSPDESPEGAAERVYTINSMRTGSALPAIPRESLRRIVERDGLGLLGVDHLFGRRAGNRAESSLLEAGEPRRGSGVDAAPSP